MLRARTIRRRLRLVIESEQGIALPVALFATIAAMALAGVAVLSSVDVQSGTSRDNGSKSAIAAADAGANVARFRLNQHGTVLASNACLTNGSGGEVVGGEAEADGWCPEMTGVVGDATYSYRVSGLGSTSSCESSVCVVSTGTAGGVVRRVEIAYGSSGSGELVTEGKEGEGKEGVDWSTGAGIDGVIGDEHVEIDNNADARVNVGTNGDIHVHNNGNVCGNIRHGVGKEVTFDNNGTQCSGYQITEANVDLPPVSSFMPTDIATNNSDYRLVECTKTNPVKEPAGCESDGYSAKWKETVPWDAATRTISTSNNKTLTLTGGDYWACKLELSNNSHLIIGDGAIVRVFFDTPENCGLSNGAKQIDISNNANITSTGYQPTAGQYNLPGFYLMGSTSISTQVEWSNNSGTNEFVLYAPNTEIHLKNNATYIGIIAGKTVHLDENAIVKQDGGFVLPPILNPWKEAGEGGGEPEAGETPPATIFFTPQSYVECTGVVQAGQAPNSDC